MYITLHWWNLGRKTLDFKGNLKDYLKDKSIRLKKIKHPKLKDYFGYRVKFELSSRVVRLDIFGDSFEKSALEGILIFLTLLGDKATISAPGFHKNINWY